MTWEKHVHMRDEGVWMTHMMMRRRLPLAPEARFDSSAHTSSPITESRPTTDKCTSTHVSDQSPCREANFRNPYRYPCIPLPFASPFSTSTRVGHTGGGLVEEDDLGVAEQLGTNGETLPLTARQALDHGELPPADHRVGAARQLTLLDHLLVLT